MNFNRNVFLVFNLLIISYSNSIFSQTPGWLWVDAMGETAYDYARSIAKDNNGDIYITGSFTGTVDFDPGPKIVNLSSSGKRDIFIAKYDSFGSLIWAKAIGGLENDDAVSIAINQLGNEIYILGNFNELVDFDPGAGIYQLNATGREDMFILKLDQAGNFLWVKSIGVTNTIKPSFIGIEPSTGCVYTTGYFYGIIDFDPGPAIFNLKSHGESDIFITKLDSLGNFIWAKSLGGPSYECGNSIAFDHIRNGNIYITGRFKGSADFDPGQGVYNISSGGDFDIFIVKLDQYGNFLWAKGFGGSGNDQGISIAVDSKNGDVYTTGGFNGIVDFDPGPHIANLFSDALGNTFILKLDPNGNYLWAKSIHGKDNNSGVSILLDQHSEDVYVIGGFQDTTNFNPGPKTYYLTSSGENNIFIVKFDRFGQFMWSKSVEGKSQSVGSSTLDDSGYLYVTGAFYIRYIMFDSIYIENFAVPENNGRTPFIPKIFIAKLDTIAPLQRSNFNKNSFIIYPFNVTNYLTIEFYDEAEKNPNVTITNIAGEIVYLTETPHTLRKKIIDTSKLRSGVYYINIEFNGRRTMKKIMKL